LGRRIPCGIPTNVVATLVTHVSLTHLGTGLIGGTFEKYQE
jgi:hypothetical protein